MAISLPVNGLTRRAMALCACAAALALAASAQEPKVVLEKPSEPAAAESPFTIEKLDTRVRFEADGASRREVHAIIKIHSEEGARQFSRLNFDYNRAFERVEIPLLGILHGNGGTTEILPSAVADQPNPAVADAPALDDLRRKSARILGLQPGDTLEYRAITSVSHHPLAPDFWLAYSFARDVTVREEAYELDLPASRQVQMHVNPEIPGVKETSGEGGDARIIYRWQRAPGKAPAPAQPPGPAKPDLLLTSYADWHDLAQKLGPRLSFLSLTPEVRSKAQQLVAATTDGEQKLRILYEFVSHKIRTVDLPLGATGYRLRGPEEILSSGYAIPEEKCALLSALASALDLPLVTRPAVILSAQSHPEDVPRPSLFTNVLVQSITGSSKKEIWLDPALEVAPFGMVSSSLRDRLAVPVASTSDGLFATVPADLPFPGMQSVAVSGTIAPDGKLTAHVKYEMRGDNELILRIAFHKAPREQWKGLAQLLSFSDGFRGQVSNAVISDPTATLAPFTVEYDIAQPRLVDWSKSPVRLPIPLPTLGLPEGPAKSPIAGTAPIDLGTPLEVRTRLTLRLPPRRTARAPVPTTVRRDYAEFTSTYSARVGLLSASRRLKFLLREIPSARAADYAAFVRAVQNDEGQEFTLERAQAPRTPPRPSAPRKPN